MALDLVEAGTPEQMAADIAAGGVKTLPDGVSSKFLYNDILRIAWPSLIELTLTQLASMVDMMMIGQLGAWALTSVGLTTQPKFLLMSLFMAMNVGATALIARNKGAGNKAHADMILRQAITMTFTISIVMSALGFVFARELVHFMGAQDEQTLAGGTAYLQIQMLGFVFMALTTTITAALRGAGNSKTAMVYNMVANVVNVILNYLLIYGKFGFPRMEVAGASLATIIGQFVAFLLALRAVMGNRNYVRLRFKDGMKPNFKVMKSIAAIGVPAMAEQLAMRVGMIIYTKTVASLGNIAYATHQVCMNILSLSFMIGQAFAVSATTLVGQSLGKFREDMAEHYSKRTQRLGMYIAMMVALVFVFFGGAIVSLYTNETEVITMGERILLFVAAVQPFQVSQFILAGALRGAGDTKATARITFITVLIVRPCTALFCINVLHMGLIGAWVALACDQLLRTTLPLRQVEADQGMITKLFRV